MKGDQAQPETIGFVIGLQLRSSKIRCVLALLSDFCCVANLYTRFSHSDFFSAPTFQCTYLLVFPPCPFRAIAENFIMNLVFIPVVVALTGLFGLAFVLYGVLTNKKWGGRGGKQQPRQPSKGPSSGNQKTFHRCTTPGCKFSQGRTHTANVSPV